MIRDLPPFRRVQVAGEHFFVLDALTVREQRHLPTLAIARISRGALHVEVDGWFPCTVGDAVDSDGCRLVSPANGAPAMLIAERLLVALALTESSCLPTLIDASRRAVAEWHAFQDQPAARS